MESRRVTIIRADGAVYVDGVARPVDCSALPTYFHAIQWYPAGPPAPYGEIEYGTDAQGRKLPNTRFSDLAPYAVYVQAWDALTPPPPPPA